MKKTLLTSLFTILAFLSFSQEQNDTIPYTKKHFRTLMPFEKNIVFPIWKDTTLVNSNKFEVHEYALLQWERREAKIQAREQAYKEALINYANNCYYYPGYISPYLLYPTLRYNRYYSPRLF